MLPWMVGHTWVGLPPDCSRPCPWFAGTLLMDYRKAEVYTHAPWKRNTGLSKGWTVLYYKYIDTEAGFATCYMYLNH
jgi:hypothetical protein